MASVRLGRAAGPASTRWLAHALAAVALVLGAPAALAQLPLLPGKASSAPPTAKPGAASARPAESVAVETPEAIRARLERQLAEIRAARDAAGPVPAGIDTQEAARWRDAYDAITYGLESELATSGQLERARAALAAARAADRDWKGFTDPPPYSIHKLDALRAAADTLKTRIAGQEAGFNHLVPEAKRYQDEAQRTEEARRRADEAYETADATGLDAARWRRSLAAVEVRAAQVRSGVMRMTGEVQQANLDTRKAELALVERQIAAVRPHVQFTTADLDVARRQLAAQVAGFARERSALRPEIEARQRQRADALREQERVQARVPAATPEEVAVAAARLQAADAWVEALRAADESLAGRSTLATEAAKLWDDRYAAFLATDALARRTAVEKLRANTSTLARWHRYAEDLLRVARGRLYDVESRLAATDPTAAVRPFVEEAVAATRRLVAGGERVEAAIAEATRMLNRWVADIDAVDAERDWRERLADLWLSTRESARAAWNFELFAVEDSAVIDGQTVTTARGVTVGKSVGALLLFLLGYAIVGRIARVITGRLIAKGHDAARVRTVKRWVLATTALVLALITLNVARIPLTVFAFLGGALAIGVGFGTQTIIKNLISGMILLAERRIQIGDIVDVDGVTGTVTTVDLRSTTVKSFDGLETIVPNSVLLESKVTDWTMSDHKVRRTIKVGVAYGTPMREAADLLEACARRHGNVLHDPAPTVMFEDFGDNAQVLALYFWVELGPKVGAAQVASDLRFMIEKQFAESGIVIAFPQRDIRIDAARPLRIEWDRGPPHTPAAGPGDSVAGADGRGTPSPPAR